MKIKRYGWLIVLVIMVLLVILGGIKGNQNRKEIINQAKLVCSENGLEYFEMYKLLEDSKTSSVLCIDGEDLKIIVFEHKPMALCQGKECS